MKLKKDYVLRQVAQSWVVMPLGQETINFSGLLKLNDSGAMLWKVLEKDCSLDALTEALVLKYQISESQARTDAESFLDKLMQIGCLED